MAIELKPCPLCGANMLPESDGYEHPADDTCPLDSLYIEAHHVAAWNTRAALEPARTALAYWFDGILTVTYVTVHATEEEEAHDESKQG